MKIRILWPWELPQKLSGICVVIDVNAATTNIPLLLCRQIKKLYIVNDENVIALKNKNIESLIIGESDIQPITLFDSSNLPFDIQKLILKNKTVLYMSNNGSRVIEKAFKRGASKIITASFVNIQCVLNWLKETKNQSLTLIPAGEKVFPDRKSHEDLYCAYAIKDALEKQPRNINYYVNKAKEFVSVKYYPFMKNMKANLEIEFNLNSFPVIPICYKEKDSISVYLSGTIT